MVPNVNKLITIFDGYKQIPWVINPGAGGKTRTRGGPSCLILRCSETDWDVTEHRFSEPE